MISREQITITAANAAQSTKSLARMPGVLLVEDDRALRRYLEIVLNRAGYNVLSAADGLEAMKLVITSVVDIVVTDAMMPNLSGHELCRFLKNSPKFSSLPIILLSALDKKDAGEEADQVDAFLAKPVDPDKLVECLEDLLTQVK
jgi:twitching motility two-component system response regulator PilH